MNSYKMAIYSLIEFRQFVGYFYKAGIPFDCVPNILYRLKLVNSLYLYWSDNSLKLVPQLQTWSITLKTKNEY